MLEKGIIIFSLDFELYWGVRDKKTIASYGQNLKGVHKAVPRLLDLFDTYGIHATWATVGFLFAKNQDELSNYLPQNKPAYHNTALNPYLELETRNIDPNENIYYFASHLVDLIKNAKHQEVGTHTFSHYYCLEPGQSKDQFRDDLRSAKHIASKKDIQLRSLVFPRNQFNQDYLEIVRSMGIKTYRGNEKSILYSPKNENKQSLIVRALRLIDAYINLTGHHIYDLKKDNDGLINLPASRFLRPYTHKLKHLESLKLRRIMLSMKKAAKAKKIYHIWWHPHNFGSYTEKNLYNLEKLLRYYKKLNDRYGLESLTMDEIYEKYYT